RRRLLGPASHARRVSALLVLRGRRGAPGARATPQCGARHRHPRAGGGAEPERSAHARATCGRTVHHPWRGARHPVGRAYYGETVAQTAWTVKLALLTMGWLSNGFTTPNHPLPSGNEE